ncbi:MAG: molybdate ABC transporter substrate-binding protein, partial [Isosphaeraceae bacterium]
LAVHEPSGALIQTLADLARPEIKRVALANPAFAPYGAAGKQALERAGLWEAVKPKVAQAETVRQALQFVQSGNAEAGLVGLAIAKGPGVRTIAVDPALYDPIIQGVGIVAQTKQPREAERFLRFLLGEAGQRILADFGFSPASGPGPDPAQP